MERLSLSLKTKMTLSVCLIVACFVALPAYSALRHFRQQLEENVTAQQFVLISTLAANIDDNIDSAQKELLKLAQGVPRDALQDPDRAQRFLESVSAHSNTFDNSIILFSREGDLIAETPFVPGRRGENFAFRRFLKKTIAEARPTISAPFFSSYRHRHPVLAFTAPLLDASGELIGVLAGSMDLTRPNFLGKIATTTIGRGGYLYLFDTGRTIIMHPDPSRVLSKDVPPGMKRGFDQAIAGFEGTRETVNSRGVEMLASFKRLKKANWILAVNFPRAEAYADIKQTGPSQGAALLVALGLCAAVIWFFQERLSAELQGFTSHLRQLGGKNGAERLFAAGAGSEIAPLVRAFNDLVRALDVDPAAKEDLGREPGESKMQLAVEQSPVSIVITDREGVIEYVNPKFTELTGYSSDEAVGQHSRILRARATPDLLFRELWEEITAGRQWHGEILNQKKNGEPFWESVRISPIKTPRGTITHYLAVKEDISERKALEEELRNARDVAEAANRLKSEFLANMSHEIRTPMNGVLGMTQLLSDTDLSAEQGEYVEALNSSAEALMGVINDVLDFSSLETRRLELENVGFELRASLENLLGTLAGRASGKGLALSFRIPPEVPDALLGDPGRLLQVLLNLLSNAVKFTEQGEVVLSVTGTRESESVACLQFAVADTGIGISAEMQSKVFDPFSQADASSTRRYGGTGLGLTISARLVQMMGGTLRVESEPGEGSSFNFTLRLGLQQGGGSRRVTEAPAPLAPPVVPQGGAAGDEPFDRKETLARMDGDWDLFGEVAEIFASDSRKMMAEIQDAIAAGDSRELNRAAHTLKGAISNFGARVPMELARKLEKLGKSGELAGAGEKFATLETELDRLRTALEDCAKRSGA